MQSPKTDLYKHQKSQKDNFELYLGQQEPTLT